MVETKLILPYSRTPCFFTSHIASYIVWNVMKYGELVGQTHHFPQSQNTYRYCNIQAESRYSVIQSTS